MCTCIWYMEAQTCICFVKLFCLREDSKCHTRHMQQNNKNVQTVSNRRKITAHTRGERCRPWGQKLWNRSCLRCPASARNKRGKLIFAKFSVVKDDSHCLSALRWCMRKNGNMTEEKNSNNPPEPLGWSQGFITFEPLNVKKKRKKRRRLVYLCCV